LSQVVSTSVSPRRGRAGTPVLWRVLLSQYAVLLASVLLFVVAWPFVPGLASPGNLSNLFSNMLPLLVLAVGQTVVLITAGIDLSMIAVLGACSVLGAWIMTETRHLGLMPEHAAAVPAGIAAMVLAGGLLGLLNGVAVSRLQMPPFIVTLATWMMLGGACVWGVQELKLAAAARAAAEAAASGVRMAPITTDPSIGNLPESFAGIGFKTWLGLPVMFYVAAAVALVIHLLLSRTLLGRRLYGVGQNARASLISGVPVATTVTLAYVISGLCAGIAAVLYTARLETGKPDLLGRDALLDVIGATVIGGASLFGGRGEVLWTVFGVLLFTLIGTTLNLLGLQDDKIMVAKGTVILLAASLDLLRKQHALEPA